jgi:hypothetical protein
MPPRSSEILFFCPLGHDKLFISLAKTGEARAVEVGRR